MAEPESWARNKSGYVVHRSECSDARITWSWASGKSLEELFVLTFQYGWRFCKRCIPESHKMRLKPVGWMKDGEHGLGPAEKGEITLYRLEFE